MEIDVDALQVLPEEDPEVGLWPCTKTCTISCYWRTT